MITFEPQSNILKEYIDFYYILEEDDKNNETSYFVFPIPHTVFSIVKGARLRYSENIINLKSSSKEDISFDLTTSYTKAVKVNCFGSYKEITIAFKPLGYLSFLNNPKDLSLENFLEDNSFEFDKLFEFESDFWISSLETFLLSRLNKFKHPFLNAFVEDIYNGVDKSVLDYSLEFKVSTKTFIKHCKIYLKRTPNEFKKVVRFRNALTEFKKNQNVELNLTSLGVLVSFFDQSHMIKDFRSLTGFTPKEFFKKVSKENDKVNWMYN